MSLVSVCIQIQPAMIDHTADEKLPAGDVVEINGMKKVTTSDQRRGQQEDFQPLQLRAVHTTPSGELRIFPPSPTVTKLPVA